MQSNNLKYDTRRAQLIPMINQHKSGKRQIASKKDTEPVTLLVVPQGRKSRMQHQHMKNKSLTLGEDIETDHLHEEKPSVNYATGSMESPTVSGKLSFDANSCIDFKNTLIMNTITSIRKWTIHPQLPFCIKEGDKWVPICLENATIMCLPSDQSTIEERSFVWPEGKGKKTQPGCFLLSRTGLYSLQVNLGLKNNLMQKNSQGLGVVSLRVRNIDTDRTIFQKDEVVFLGVDAWNIVLHVDQFWQIGDTFTIELTVPPYMAPLSMHGTLQLALLQSDEQD